MGGNGRRAGGSLDLYLDEIGREPLLSRREEATLARRAREEDDPEALERLVTSNLRFVVAVAKRYRGRGVPLEDLINEGNLGLMAAAERFDESRGVRFVTYAAWWIRQAMFRAIGEAGGAAPPAAPPSRRPRAVPPAAAERPAGGSGRPPLSLDRAEGDGSALLDRVPDRASEAPDRPLQRRALRTVLDTGLAFLPEREERVLRMYFGLNGGESWPLRRIGRELALSRERVRQLKERGLARLRQGPHGGTLRAFRE